MQGVLWVRATFVSESHLAQFDERALRIVLQVLDLLVVDAHHAQHQLPRQPQRQRRLGGDDAVCARQPR